MVQSHGCPGEKCRGAPVKGAPVSRFYRSADKLIEATCGSCSVRLVEPRNLSLAFQGTQRGQMCFYCPHETSWVPKGSLTACLLMYCSWIPEKSFPGNPTQHEPEVLSAGELALKAPFVFHHGLDSAPSRAGWNQATWSLKLRGQYSELIVQVSGGGGEFLA